MITNKPASAVFRRNVKTLMAYHGHTTSSLARDSGIPQKTIWTVTKGSNSPTLATVQKLADALGVSVVELLV
jgi:transcriptional regulator with XRE-family HTH domain